MVRLFELDQKLQTGPPVVTIERARMPEHDKRARRVHFIAEAPLRPEAITVSQIACLRH